MKATKISLAICLLLSFASCARESSNPKKDIVGSWERSVDPVKWSEGIVTLLLMENGKCSFREYVDPPSGNPCTYKLTTDPSGRSSLTIIRDADIFGHYGPQTRTYEIWVYENRLILRSGKSELRLSRAPK